MYRTANTSNVWDMFVNTRETLFCLSILLLSTAACGDSDASTTAVITTVITGNTSATEGPDASTGEPDTSTTTEPTTGAEETETGVSSTTEDLSTSSTSEPSQGCFNEGTECPPAPAEATFCEYVAAACASHGVEPFYCEIVNGKCDVSRDVDECQVCFALENYCAQIGSDCGGLMTECLCAHAALEGGE